MPTSTPGGGQHETVILQDDIFIIGNTNPYKVVTVTQPTIPGPYVEKLVYSIVTGIGAVGAGRVVATNPTGIVDVTLLPPFQPPITPGSLTESGSSVLTITGGSNALLQNVQLTVTKASATTSGYLSSADWNTFNSKQNALTPANLTSTAPITVTGGVGSLLAAASISMTQAGTGSSGWLSASDWNTFNSKQGTIIPASLSSTSAALSVSGGSNSVLQNVTLSLTQADITVSAPLTITGGSQAVFSATSISMTQAGAASSGWLSSTDWNTFNNKGSSTVTPATLSSSSSVLTVTGGSNSVLQAVSLNLSQAALTVTAPLTASGTPATALLEPVTLALPQASGSQDGYLSASDWNTFNGKAPLDSPGFTGTPTAPTPATGDNSTKLATTAFVEASLGSSNVSVGATPATGVSSGAWVVTVYGTTPGTRTVVGVGSGTCTNGQTVGISGSYSPSQFVISASVGTINTSPIGTGSGWNGIVTTCSVSGQTVSVDAHEQSNPSNHYSATAFWSGFFIQYNY